ncbi:MAG: DUF559 domain-containing protein [Proteobacteria bacterium]|nr:DUF559 domain-containing protein [Pseudomonadota bacterium]
MVRSRLVGRARALRKSMTREEVRLWVCLRSFNRRGFHFRRQVPLDGYILDFAEFGHRIIIEVDGSQHAEGPRFASDQIRDRHFTAQGFRVLRFWNIDINHALDGVVLRIEEALQQPPPPLRGTSPAKGGG